MQRRRTSLPPETRIPVDEPSSFRGRYYDDDDGSSSVQNDTDRGHTRAASSALQQQQERRFRDQEDRSDTKLSSSRSKMIASRSAELPSHRVKHVQPGYKLVSRVTLLLSLVFLAFTSVFVFVPATRQRGRAAVDSLGGYAGHAWTAAGSGWDRWRQTQEAVGGGGGAAVPTGGVSGGVKSPNVDAVRVMPPAHPDPTLTTRCKDSFDGQRSVVQYAIMIDAGSTGSRVHIYKFNYCSPSPELEAEVFEMLRPGLSSFKGDARGAADSLRPLLKRSLESIPQSLQGCTPIAVKATAGLRMLGQVESKAILAEVRRMIRSEYPFVLADGPATKGVVELTPGGGEVEGKAVEIMEGRDEGVFAWITVNYLLGLIGPPIPGRGIPSPYSAKPSSRLSTAAVMDLGGASTQIVFEPSGPEGAPQHGMRPGEHVYALRNFGGSGQDYVLYQNSYLGYGLMQARRRVNTLASFAHSYGHPSANGSSRIPSPCFAVGKSKLTPIASSASSSSSAADTEATLYGVKGGFDACRRLVEVMLDKDADCPAEPCSFAGVYQPKLLEAVRGKAGDEASNAAGIVALSYFYDRLEPLGLGAGFTLTDLERVARQACSHPSTWSTHFDAVALAELNDRPETCLDLTYMHSLLSLGYDLRPDESIAAAATANKASGGDVKLRIEKKLGGIELGWALGAAVGMLGEMSLGNGQCAAYSGAAHVAR